VAGGLIQSVQEIEHLVKQGVNSVFTSDVRLWGTVMFGTDREISKS